MSRVHFLTAAIVCAVPATALANAQIVILNNDGPGEGFNDQTPATPAGGNPGTTVGAQRLNAFQFAADRWGELLDSSVTITIRAQFNPQFCDATSATLGSAGAISVFRDFPNAPVSGTWFSAALANKLEGEDLDPATPEINATFNSALNGDPACLGGASWYYGFDHNEGANQIDLMPVLMHEFGHGLGFQSFVSRSAATLGQLLLGFPDHYLIYMFDNQVGKYWRNMTDAERATSMRNGRRVVWNGPNILSNTPYVLEAGTAGLSVVSPAPVAGRYQVGEASFGPRLPSTPISGNLLYAPDTTGSTQGCSAYGAGTFTGRIALIDRGTCTFNIKVKNAQDAGALAVVVADNAPGSPPAGLGGADATVTIPSVRITQANGNAIKAQLATTTVAVQLLLDMAVLAGADEADRVMLNTPDPVVPGSSVSHFDPSTSPNTLMEPAINADLSTDVDLTLSVFRDVGWYADFDVDLVPDAADNCIAAANGDQSDLDADLVGDVCDDDDDADGAADVNDNCPTDPNAGQENTDGDALGNECDPDDDNDTVLDATDNCPLAPNTTQDDRNTDGAGDACDDEDSDGFVDAVDNCPDAANPNQDNADGDALGDACDADDDNDTVLDAADNCPLVANMGQENADADADGDACDGDDDGDTIADAADNCPLNANMNQEDTDGDALGNACDPDDDNDAVSDGMDNCPLDANAGQENTDGDTLGNACDPDDDNDNIADATDNCPVNANMGQENADSDMAGNACDPDDDNDTIADATDNCPLNINFGQEDADNDAQGDVCDTDDDNDGDLDTADNCVTVANADQLDTDGDNAGNACDVDDDADGVLDTADNCALVPNIGQSDADADGVGDLCDPDFEEDDGGCCSTGKRRTPPAGTLLLVLSVIVILRRRRR